ncbi:hypothetical protein Micbo1qcDRAFT_124939 [Microdochium bolleyi]|uniref:Uncharacterized protein n=1 Tax=Microdochium bolleyi TaxID=196109 RepID=A0A136IR72_9PEZI|nr:hypothetical protein Micbo1qcDRAFT_124939 [Microdochium bolleyi]
MAFITTKNYFLSLAALATFLLWGISLANGTVTQLIMASWHGALEDGTDFHTKYTGLFLLDFPISLLVAFFYFGTNGHDLAYQYFLIDAYSTLQSAFVWLYVESNRRTEKPRAVNNPIIWGLLWQCFGAAIALPLYFYNHLHWLGHSQNTQGSSVLATTTAASAAAIPISFIIGAVAPAIIGMLPTWLPRASQAHQMVLAFWQPDPVWVSITQAVFTALFAHILIARGRSEASRWIRASYALAAVSSATGHSYATYKALWSGEPGVSWWRMYVPKDLTGIREGTTLVDGPWLFLQYDLIIIALSSISWAFLLVKQLLGAREVSTVRLALVFLLGHVIIGPGATVSLALYWRERKLEQNRQVEDLQKKRVY